MENITRMAILSYVEQKNLLFMEQHSLRKGLSCLTNLLIARKGFAGTKDSNIPVDVTFMDLNQASDKVCHMGLKSKLESIVILYNIIKSISDFSVIGD